jgi:hypothetical protein
LNIDNFFFNLEDNKHMPSVAQTTF